MLNHVLMFRIKNGADKSENVQRLKNSLEGLKDKIAEIKSLEVGLNVLETPASYDLFYHTQVEDTEALERYRAHPDHKKVLDLIGQICSDKTVVDYFS